MTLNLVCVNLTLLINLQELGKIGMQRGERGEDEELPINRHEPVTNPVAEMQSTALRLLYYQVIQGLMSNAANEVLHVIAQLGLQA